MRNIFTILFLLLSTVVSAQNGHYIYGFDSNDTDARYRFIIDTTHYKHNVWQMGRPQKKIFDSALSLPNALVTDTLSSCQPNDTSVVILKLPYLSTTIDHHLGALWQVQFDYRLNIDSGDLARIEIAVDSSERWLNIVDSLPVGTNAILDSPFNISTKGWRRVDIQNLWGFMSHNDSFSLRITFITGSDTTARDGWLIDNFWAPYEYEDIPIIHNDNLIHTYPNPSNGNFTIRSTNTDKAEIFIYDLSGRQVWQQPSTGLSTKIYVSLHDGIYVLKYQTDKEMAVKRLLIRQ